MEMLTVSEDKIAVFTDIHWGKSRDSMLKLKLAADFVDFFILESKARGANVALFMGDWFDNRSSLNVLTLNYAKDALEKLGKAFESVIMVVGNHDTYFRERSEINSVEQYKNIPNVTVIKDPTLLKFKHSKKTMLLCPWHWEKAHIVTDEQPNYAAGHFEVNGVYLAGSTVFTSSSAPDTNSIAAIAKDLVLSGHFHIRKEYPCKDGRLMMVGSPLQLDWGDYGNEKGFYVLEPAEGTLDFVHNTVSPTYVKLSWKQLNEGTQKINADRVKGNFLKLVIDDKYEYKNIAQLTDAIKKLNPLSFEEDFIFSIGGKLMLKDLEGDSLSDRGGLKYTHLDYCVKYIEKMSKEEGMIDGVNRQELIDTLRQYYDTVMTGSEEK